MEPLNSCSLGAMGSLLKKLDELLCTEERAQGLIGDLRSISTKMEKLSEVYSPSHTVKYWMNDARELSYDMEICVDQFVHASQPEDLPAMVERKLTWTEEILGFEVRVKEVNERCDRYNLVNKYVLSSNPAKIVVSHHLRTAYKEPEPVGMEEPTKKLLEWLMPRGHGEEDLKLKVVSVLGDEGVGKTTLVKRLWQESSQDKFEFKCRAFVQTAKKPDTRMVLRSILSQVCPKQPLNTYKVPKLIHHLREHLQDKRAFGSEQGCPPQFNYFTDEITRKCGGFPLAIICTARLVASQPETEQEQQLDFVTKFLPNNLKTHSSSLEILNQVLKLCYSNLPHCLKTCLLYLSMYPENYLFLKEDLVKQWIAEDFICTPEWKDKVDVAGSYFDELLRLGLIQRMDMVKSYKKGLLSYKVHPVVLDFITCKSMEDNFITIIDYSQSTVVFSEKVRRLSLHFGSATYATTPESVELSQVRSLSFIGLLGCMPSIAEFKLVRVMILHIFSDDVDSRFSLSEICHLLQLIYLQVRSNVTVELPKQMQCLKHLGTLEINTVENVPWDIVHLSRLWHVRLGEKTNRTPSQIASVDWSRLPCPNSVSLQSFELLHPICIFSRLPQWFVELHKLRILEIVVRRLLSNDINLLAELPVLKHLSLHVQTPPNAVITVGTGMFLALEYFKLVCGVLLLCFHGESLPNLGKLKLVFNAHRGEQYSNMLVGISHLLNLKKVAGSIGLAPGAEESDRIAAESAFKDAIRKHPCYDPSLEQVKRGVPVEEDWNQQEEEEESSTERGRQVPLPIEHGQGQAVPLWKLAFQSSPQLRSIYTQSKIEDYNGNPWNIILVELDTAGSNKSALPRALSIELVPLVGDFPAGYRHKDYWTADEFEKAIVREREGKPPLLTGNVRLTMVNGRATVGELKFTDNSFWVRSHRFCIGARVVPGSYDGGGRIVEAITEAFSVRGQVYEKHYPPALGDPVWRLEWINKEGAFHGKLRRNNVETVQELVRMLMVKPDELRAILGDITDCAWEETTNHAKTCNPGDKVYAYNSAGSTIYVNSVFSLVKVEIGGAECPLQQLNRDQTMLVRQLTLEAYEERCSFMDSEKHYPPSLGDSVCKLSNITKEGTFHSKLERRNVKTVQDFLRMLMVKPDHLRAILGNGMNNLMWEETTKHARTCAPGNKVYVYAAQGATIYVNSVFNLVKVEIGGLECPLQQLNWDQMALVLMLIMEAYENRHDLQDSTATPPTTLRCFAHVLKGSRERTRGQSSTTWFPIPRSYDSKRST